MELDVLLKKYNGKLLYCWALTRRVGGCPPAVLLTTNAPIVLDWPDPGKFREVYSKNIKLSTFGRHLVILSAMEVL
ncbi:hypothetical protein TNCV_2206001 [Trichonephila clavipes]|nr:hypothetical protein TNCV_2206001 [Trichonephila clavipes]